MKLRSFAPLFFLVSSAIVLPAFATVSVSSPANASTVGASVPFVATGVTSTCSKGVASMGVYVDNSLIYQVSGSTLNTTLSIAGGTHRAVVEEWDFCGGATATAIILNVNTTAGVSVAAPLNGASVASPTTFAATGAAPNCSAGVDAMQIYANDALVYTVAGSAINTALTLSPGANNLVVKEWDKCGAVATSALAVNVVAGTKLSNLQRVPNWNQWGELPPNYAICTSCSGISWIMAQNVTSFSLSGNATKFTIGGTTPYADVLWSNKLIGQGTTLGIPDTARTIIPNIHHFVYDTDVYLTSLGVTQALEFDANLYLDGVGLEWGTECNHLADGVWDIWNNVNAQWVSTSVPCSLNDGAWNHINLTFERLANNDLIYHTITVNGVTSTLDIRVAPFAVPASWYGVTLNYQMDGNRNMATNNTYLDNLSLTYY